MSTNAMIGFSRDGVKAVYSHWDGYPTEMGRNLNKFFPTLQDAKALVQGGDLSAICNKTGKITYYSEFLGQKILEQDYEAVQDAQDFKIWQDYKDVTPMEYGDVLHYANIMYTDSRGTPIYEDDYMSNIEYLYVHMKGEWHVSDNGIDWDPIEDFIRYEERQKARSA
jgi:hypothetical protein